jgi:hypothetical protein
LLLKRWGCVAFHQPGAVRERSIPAMYDLLVVVVALATFVALAGFVIFCERI